MIQRIQTVYLILGALCLGALIFLDPIQYTQAARMLAWYVTAVTIAGAATATVALLSVFAYKNRSKQIKIVAALQIMTLVFMVLLYGGLFLAGDFDVLRAGGGELSLLLILLLPIVAYVFFYLARRAIQRDIDLVKSMDRLR